MFEYLGLAYRNSDYTTVITIMHWPECKKLVLKLTLVVEIWAWGVLGKAHEDSDHTAVIAVVHWRHNSRAGSSELQYLACATSELQPVAAAATRSAVAPRNIIQYNITLLV